MDKHLTLAKTHAMTTPSDKPHVRIIDAIVQLGAAGKRLSEIDASEGASGNLSVFLRGPNELPTNFTQSESLELPFEVPELAGGWCVVTGSGTRSREIERLPDACLGCVEFDRGGTTARLWSAPSRQFARITSEFSSHLSVHRDHVSRRELAFHAVVHAQPRKVTYLSHLRAYRDETHFNRRLLRWQPEAILNFPEGIAVVPFLVPSGRELACATASALANRRIAVWSKHGVIARSSSSVLSATDRIEYLETAAAYECLDRMLGGEAEGLDPQELREICTTYKVEPTVF